MIRPLTCVCMLLAASSGLYLYQTKHRTRLLDKTIESTLAATDVIHERTRLLNAEWALLNDPSRLGELAAKFLTLRPVAPSQFVTAAELEKHLPAVREFPPAGALPSEPPAETPLAQLAPPAPTHPPATAPTPPKPVQMAAAAAPKPQPRPAPAAVAETKPETPLAPPAPRLLARSLPERTLPEHPAHHDPVVAALPAPRPASPTMGSPTIGAVAGPMATPVSNPVMMNSVLSRVMATNAPTVPTNTVQSISRVGFATSALGNARTNLAPPVPVAVNDSVAMTGVR